MKISGVATVLFNVKSVEELVENFCQYEDKNLRAYAGNEFESFLVFKNPQRPDIKETVDNLAGELRNPYLVVRLWLKWEMLDILAIIEAMNGKSKLESKRQKYIQKKTDD